MTQKIELTPRPGFPGHKMIMVDGLMWGRVHCNHHGSMGTSYNFSPADGGLIYRDSLSSWNRTPVQVDGDKLARRRANNGEVPAPLAERLMVAVRKLIADGKLRHPEVIGAEKREAAAKARAEEEERKAKEDTEWEARASAAIAMANLAPALRLPDRQRLAKRIIEAMRWAQSQ